MDRLIEPIIAGGGRRAFAPPPRRLAQRRPAVGLHAVSFITWPICATQSSTQLAAVAFLNSELPFLPFIERVAARCDPRRRSPSGNFDRRL
jgi:hypothetical protein